MRVDRPRSGGPAIITPEKAAEIVRRTLEAPPAGTGTHWSTRTLAPLVGVSPASVGRIWRAHGLQPHRTKSFKLSKYPDFVEKLRDVVGLYVDPPEQLIEVITAYIDRGNVGPKPSTWIATVQHILEKVTKAHATLEALH